MNEVRVDRMVRELQGPPPPPSPPREFLHLCESSWALWAMVLAMLFLAACI